MPKQSFAPRRHRTSALAFTATFAAFLALAAVGSANMVGYTDPIDLAEVDQGAELQVAADPEGRATVVWERRDGPNDRIQAVRLDADGEPGTVHTLSEAGEDAWRPQVAVDPDGRATVVWLLAAAPNWRIQAVRLGADGEPGAVHTLSEAGQSTESPKVAVDTEGRATVVWQRYDGSDDRIQAVRLDAAGNPGTVQTLSDAGEDAGAPHVAIDPVGQATVVWRRFDGSDDRIQAVRLDAAGNPGTVQTLSDPGETALTPQVAVDTEGWATVVWRRSDGSKWRIEVARLDADGEPGTVHTLSDAGEDAWRPHVEVDPDGRATVVWERSDGSDDRIQAVSLDADGEPGTIQILSEAGEDAGSPHVAIDPDGQATVVWRRSDGWHGRIQAVRLDADSEPGTVHTLSKAGEHAGWPRVAVDPEGRATVAWDRFNRIQAARSVLDDPPPEESNLPPSEESDSDLSDDAACPKAKQAVDQAQTQTHRAITQARGALIQAHRAITRARRAINQGHPAADRARRVAIRAHRRAIRARKGFQQARRSHVRAQHRFAQTKQQMREVC